MSFFSKSSKGHHYKNGNNGYNHYKSKGTLGNLFNTLLSRSHSKDCNDPYYQPNQNQQSYTNQSNPNQHMNQNQQMYPNHPMQENQTVSNTPPIWQQNNLICSKCNSKIPVGSKFCLECGDKVNVPLVCPNCKEKLVPNAKFCMNCGSKI